MENKVKSKEKHGIKLNVDDELYAWIAAQGKQIGLQPGVAIRAHLLKVKNSEGSL